jgi:hypothetical protein
VSDLLLGDSRPRETALFWNWRFRVAGEVVHHSPMLAVREGDYKLLMNADKSRIELYDIPRDPTQLSNLAEKHPDLVERLSTKLLTWNETLPEGPTDARAGQPSYGWPGKPAPSTTSRAVSKGRSKAKSK